MLKMATPVSLPDDAEQLSPISVCIHVTLPWKCCTENTFQTIHSTMYYSYCFFFIDVAEFSILHVRYEKTSTKKVRLSKGSIIEHY